MNNKKIAAILILLMTSLTWLYTQNSDTTKRQAEIDTELAKLSKQKKSILNEIYKLELRYEKENINLHNVQNDLKAQNQKIGRLNLEKQTLNADMQKTRQNLKKTLRIMYKSTHQPALLFFIRISSFNNLYLHYRYFLKLFDFKATQISRLKEQMVKIAQIETQMTQELQTLKKIEQKSEATLKTLEERKTEQIRLMEKVNSDHTVFSQMLEELKSQNEELDKVISEQPHYKRIEKVKSSDLKGKMPRPLKGRLVNRFGKVRSSKFNTFVFNNGIKIRPEQNDAVSSVFPGVVVFSNYFKGYGNLIIVRHSKDLYTLYGHCKELKKTTGDWVQQGETVAIAGDSGSTIGKVLYFEVRRGVKSEDPLQWFSR